VGEGKPVAPSFLLACALWSDVRDGWAARQKDQHVHPALVDAIEDVFVARIGDVSGRGKLAGDMREIWLMQPRFEKRVGSAPFGLVEQPRFRAAFDFMRLRAENGELEEVLSDWWEEFSLADDNLRRDMVDEVKLEQQQRPRASRPPRALKVPSTTGMTASSGAGSVESFDGAKPENTAPRKRRRRRRNTNDNGNGQGVGGDTSTTPLP
jgi:poly(A) polymerase